jgi:hypothetical protein
VGKSSGDKANVEESRELLTWIEETIIVDRGDRLLVSE